MTHRHCGSGLGGADLCFGSMGHSSEVAGNFAVDKRATQGKADKAVDPPLAAAPATARQMCRGAIAPFREIFAITSFGGEAAHPIGDPLRQNGAARQMSALELVG